MFRWTGQVWTLRHKSTGNSLIKIFQSLFPNHFKELHNLGGQTHWHKLLLLYDTASPSKSFGIECRIFIEWNWSWFALRRQSVTRVRAIMLLPRICSSILLGRCTCYKKEPVTGKVLGKLSLTLCPKYVIPWSVHRVLLLKKNSRNVAHKQLITYAS